MTVILWCLFFLIPNGINARTEEGYSRGLLSVCPGSTKPATIPRSQLQYLYFVVQGKGRSRQRYTYWNAKNIATDPRMDFKRKTLLVAIGYLDSTSFPISSMFANEYEDRNYNIILVDNQRFATVHYYLATRLMRPVGKHVAEVLVQLTRAGLNPSKLELLGFSLGGQTVSYIASNFQKLTGQNISRITALEPAGPCFRTLGVDDRLDASNADFVQVVHTNIDGFGMAAKMGHVDFYVNGGEYQPSDLNLFPCTTTCSHFRVLALWLSALKNPDKFVAIKCDSIQQARDALCYKDHVETNVMGLNVDTKNHGIFYLSTSKGYPFYLGKKGLKAKYASWRHISDINESDDIEVYT
ncbi:pancreatic lipase-related protein 2-like [Epargyreus clarus]|uniref:pancreatic lipase-related protein 2-like n=1 Tax=Epargyreus clarus TaxID=520877 RepID=UPI003C2DEB6D